MMVVGRKISMTLQGVEKTEPWWEDLTTGTWTTVLAAPPAWAHRTTAASVSYWASPGE
jgi:hypothetical protein